MILVIGIFFMIVSFLVSRKLKKKFEQYSQIPLASGLSGKQAAEQMLTDHGIYDVKIISTPGQLTDHYNPSDKTVNLSEEVYHGRNAAAVAVATHECGHAVQHATAYNMLRFRTMMVPVQNASGMLLNVIVIASIFGSFALFRTFNMQMVLMAIIGCYSVMTLFSFVTLPVEFDASRRALNWISQKGIVTRNEYDMSKDALKWAAMTYVVAAIASLTTLLYYISLLTGGSNDD